MQNVDLQTTTEADCFLTLVKKFSNEFFFLSFLSIINRFGLYSPLLELIPFSNIFIHFSSTFFSLINILRDTHPCEVDAIMGILKMPVRKLKLRQV